jgi:hypothetical protein
MNPLSSVKNNSPEIISSPPEQNPLPLKQAIHSIQGPREQLPLSTSSPVLSTAYAQALEGSIFSAYCLQEIGREKMEKAPEIKDDSLLERK